MKVVLRATALLLFAVAACLHAQPVVERLSDVCPGGCDGFRADASNYAVGKTRVYFAGRDSSDNNLDRPWVSDGTPGGTIPLARIATDGFGVGLSSMVTVGDVLFFSARTAASGDWPDGRRLWRSDGTPAGTAPVDFPLPAPKQLIPIDANAGVHALSRGVVYPTNLGIWWVPVDGAIPRKLAEGLMVGPPAELNGAIYFLETACKFQCAPGTAAMLRRYDGNVVTSLGSFAVVVSELGDPIAKLTATPAGLFMTTPQTLWTSDGSNAPSLLRQWIPPASVYLPPPIANAPLLLDVYPGTGIQSQLWTSDGTVAGTRAITTVGAAARAVLLPLGIAGATMVLSVYSGAFGSGYADVPEAYPRYSELADLDPAYPTGTRALRSLASGSGTAVAPTYAVAFDGGLMFSAGYLWYTDGTAGGTQFVDPDLFDGIAKGQLLGSIGRTLFFAGAQNGTGQELYRITLPAGYPASHATVEVTEYYHAGFDHYFVTGNPAEKANLDSGATAGWARTGFGFTAYAAGAGAPDISPVCRFYGRPEAGLDSHFYSASPQECADVIAKFSHAWIYESPDVFEVALPGATGRCAVSQAPIYRAFNKRPDVNHRYSVHALDQKAMQAKGWQPEGATSAGLVMCALAVQRP